jgi:ATP-dependent DNA helicase 2 subunit 1
LLSSLLSEINSKAVARRALFSNLPLEIGPGFKISVRGYIIFKKQTIARSCYIWTHGEKPLIPKLVTTRVADDTAGTVEKWEVKKAYRFGGEQIPFTPEEIAALRNFGDPGIRIIGFKPLSMLPLWASTKRATFIYPSEKDYVGSTRVFSALQQKLLKDQKMAVTWFIARRNAVPAVAALIPGEEKLGEHGQQVVPPGLWLIELPYADDMRQKPELPHHVVAPDELVDKMRPVILQLQLPKAQYDPSKYPDPGMYLYYPIELRCF